MSLEEMMAETWAADLLTRAAVAEANLDCARQAQRDAALDRRAAGFARGKAPSPLRSAGAVHMAPDEIKLMVSSEDVGGWPFHRADSRFEIPSRCRS